MLKDADLFDADYGLVNSLTHINAIKPPKTSLNYKKV